MKMKKDFSDFEKLDKELAYLKKHYVLIGVLSEEYADGVSVKEYAIYNEYGTINIPARPFFRSVIENSSKKKLIQQKLNDEINEVVNLNKTAENALNAIGLYVVGMIKESLITGSWSPNSAGTIALKGKNTPLRDTGTLLKSISYEIRRK